MKQKALILCLLSAAPLSAFAETYTVAAKISTLGGGLDLAIPVTESIDARLGFNTFSRNINKNSNGTNFSGKLNLGTLTALADWHPMNSSFRLTGGLMYNNNKLTMTAVPIAGNVTIGGTTYTAAQAGTASSKVDFNKIAPYLGFGWGSAPKNTGLSFNADFGIMFQGAPRANVTATGVAVTAASLAQANTDLNNSLSNYRYYPVASVGIAYSF